MKLINARLPGAKDLQQIEINELGIIESITPNKDCSKSEKKEQVIDLKGDWISLGGVDLQINGGLGIVFSELKEKDISVLPKISDFLWNEGIDGFLPTLVTTSVENIWRSLEVIKEFMKRQKEERKDTSQVLGVHLEGPFLNSEKRGAHPAKYLLHPTVETVEWVLGDHAEIVKIMTLAPELDLSGEVIPYLRSRGIIVSVGHSQATDEQGKQAFKQGASMVTHAFNAMPNLHHRKPGLLGEAIVNKNVYCGLIADGQHVCPTMIDILLRASHYEQGVFLVSDALAPIGLPDGIYPWDERQIEVKNGTARLADGTLAGTTLSLFVGVENLVKWGICELGVAIALATEAPRKAIGLGGIAVGQAAEHLLRWFWDEEREKLGWERLTY